MNLKIQDNLGCIQMLPLKSFLTYSDLLISRFKSTEAYTILLWSDIRGRDGRRVEQNGPEEVALEDWADLEVGGVHEER